MIEGWALWLLGSVGAYLLIAITSLIGWFRNTVPRHPAALPIHILIPAHNEADCIGCLLEDLTKQELPPNFPYRIIVVDDRSTDSTTQIVEKYLHRLPIELLRIEKLPDGIHGKLHAMMKATENLTEGSVLMVDADCRVGPRWITAITQEAGVGGAVGPVFEIGRNRNLIKEILTDDQGGITFAAMGLIASGYPLTASTANMLIPVSAIRDGLWDRVGVDGTGEDGRILQDQFFRGLPMRAVIHPDAGVVTYLAPTYRHTAASRRRWYQDALTYRRSVQFTHIIIGLTLLGLASAIPALFVPVVWKYGLAVVLLKLLNDFIVWCVVNPKFPYFTLRSVFLWSPIEAWILISYALIPAPPKTQHSRGFSD